MKKNNSKLNALKLVGAMAIASSTNNAQTQVPREITFQRPQLEIFAGYNRDLSNNEPNYNSFFEVGFQQITQDAGVGAIFSFPLSRSLLETNSLETRFERQGTSPSAIIEELVIESYYKKNSIEAIMSFEKESISPFFTAGVQVSRRYDVLTKSTTSEYLFPDGSIIYTPKVVGNSNVIGDAQSYFLGGLGFKFKGTDWGAYMKVSTTFFKPRNDLHVSAGITYKFPLKTESNGNNGNNNSNSTKNNSNGNRWVSFIERSTFKFSSRSGYKTQTLNINARLLLYNE